MEYLDLQAFDGMPLTKQPFQYLIVPGFVRAEAMAGIHADFPKIEEPGSFPAETLEFGPKFRGLLEALEGPDFRKAVAKKFSLDLEGRPTTITVRGRCGTKDGNIHTDSLNKIITVLVYMNPSWEQPGGRLRLLRSGKSLDDVLAEVSPNEGTLVCFRRSDNSYHGHKPFIGERRVLQLNWVTGQGSKRMSMLRHRVSAAMKRCVPWLDLRVRGGAKKPIEQEY